MFLIPSVSDFLQALVYVIWKIVCEVLAEVFVKYNPISVLERKLCEFPGFGDIETHEAWDTLFCDY
jgi:hypothetical protein